MSDRSTPTRDGGLLDLAAGDCRRRARPAELGDRLRLKLDWFLTGRHPEPEPATLGVLEPAQPGRIGVCCSGGGVRSAAYNLGALQALDGAHVLRRATYLAAVSGGSYIAAAFAMVARTDADARRDDSDPSLLQAPGGGPFHPGSPEEQYLRNRASYLAPGAMGKVFLLQRVLAGLAFNLLFIGTFLFVAGLLLVLAYVQLYGGLTGPPKSTVFAPADWLWAVPAAIAAVGAALAIVTVVTQLRFDALRLALEDVVGAAAAARRRARAAVGRGAGRRLRPAETGEHTRRRRGDEDRQRHRRRRPRERRRRRAAAACGRASRSR